MKYASKASNIALVMLIPFAAGLAQTAPKEGPSKWSLSLGIDAINLDLSTRDPGVDARFAATLTRIWQAPGSRFSRHISLMAGADAPRGVESMNSLFCQGCSSSVGQNFAGLTAGGAIDLFHISRLTPYVQGGAGFYYDRSWSKLTDPSRPGTQSFKRNDFSFGLNTGVGIKARLGSHELFIEQTFHSFQALPLDRAFLPLNFGIRF
jgi:hypothetical protein